MSKAVVRLWLVRETAKARQYCKFAPHPDLGFSNAELQDKVWVPLSIIEHTTKRGEEHEVTLPDWFIEKSSL